uniref:Uncharacterized protein n=1 Tax=Glossina austeni TaxID=7395 RepID=A0A1A9VP27_GLOAU
MRTASMVSFGSSKGSMVETLVFETPTPLSEHVEPNFGFGYDGDRKTTAYNMHTKINMDDSGIEVQEEGFQIEYYLDYDKVMLMSA